MRVTFLIEGERETQVEEICGAEAPWDDEFGDPVYCAVPVEVKHYHHGGNGWTWRNDKYYGDFPDPTKCVGDLDGNRTISTSEKSC